MFLLLSHVVMAIYKAEYINKKVSFGELQRLFFHQFVSLAIIILTSMNIRSQSLDMSNWK